MFEYKSSNMTNITSFIVVLLLSNIIMLGITFVTPVTSVESVGAVGLGLTTFDFFLATSYILFYYKENRAVEKIIS